MTLWIDNLAQEAADPTEAGRKMRQCFYTLGKLTKRQLTLDCLRKLCVRRVGTHEVERMARMVVRGEGRRNSKIVVNLLGMKLEDAMEMVERLKKQFMREKVALYMTISRGGMIKEEFWSKVDAEMRKVWVEGKSKIQRKVDRLEDTYKGAKTYTGLVDKIRVGDRELGEEEEEVKEPLAAGVQVSESEAKVLRKDPRFRDWTNMTIEDIEVDINVGLDNIRREINKLAENGGQSLTKEQEEVEKDFTRVLNLEDKTLDFGKMRSTAMKQNKYFVMSKAVNRKDELVLQRLKDKMIEGSKDVIKKTNDEKGRPRETCYSEEERLAIRSLRERRSVRVVVCGTDKSQVCGIMSEEEWMASMEVHTRGDEVVTMEEVDSVEKRLMGFAFQLTRGLRGGVGHSQSKVLDNLRSEHVSIPNLYALIKDHKEMREGEPVKSRPVCGAVESPNGQLSNMLSEVINMLTKVEDKLDTECRSSEEMRASVKKVNTKEGEGDRVIGSTDFKSYYPRLPVRRAAAIVGRMAELSELDIKTDDTEMGLFLASTMTRVEVVAMGLEEVVQERLHSRSAAPGITSREILERGPTCGTKWRPPSRAPTEQERRRMLGKMLELAIVFCMENHFYMLKGEVRRQARGAGIGLRCSEALGNDK